MSQQKLSTIQRLAIWHAHNQKCAYTREPLTYSDLEIDHIIPERLKDDKSELAKTLEQYNLPADFSIFSYKNMLPVHSRVNSQKSGTVFTDENARYYLEIANQKYDRVKEIEKELLKKIKSSDGLSSLSAAIEAGWISNLEAINYLQALISKNNGIELLHELDFIEQTFQGRIEPDAAVGLLDLKVKHGNSREIGLELTGPDGKIRVFSCREFSDAKKKGYYAYTTYDMKMEAFFNRTCDMINAIMHARIARESHVGNPRIGINDIAYLPLSIIDTISPEQQELIEKDGKAGKSLKDWLEEGFVRIIGITSASIHIEHRWWKEGSEYGFSQILTELLRADFNNDGIEDILVSSNFGSIGGTFGYGVTKLISRLNANEGFREISCPWRSESE